jgi:quercetin dioxygenase-like cupin family protein
MADAPASPAIRRVVTGHDPAGKAIVVADGPATNRVRSGRGETATLIWSSDQCPAEMWTGEDFGARAFGATPSANGSLFYVLDVPPGVDTPMPQSDTLTYAMCLAGAVDLDLAGSTSTLAAGDVAVLQATGHRWINRGHAAARLAVATIDAKRPPAGRPMVAAPVPPPLPSAMPPPEYRLRRVVTSHDAAGNAIVMWDGQNPQWTKTPRGIVTRVIWGSDESPAEVWTRRDFGAREEDVQPPPRGNWFRVIDYVAAAPGRMHRTDSVDYVVCMSGSIEMLLDDSSVVLRAGDVMVQQGTNHSWVNRGPGDCRIAFVLIDAKAGRNRTPGHVTLPHPG